MNKGLLMVLSCTFYAGALAAIVSMVITGIYRAENVINAQIEHLIPDNAAMALCLGSACLFLIAGLVLHGMARRKK